MNTEYKTQLEEVVGEEIAKLVITESDGWAMDDEFVRVANTSYNDVDALIDVIDDDTYNPYGEVKRAKQDIISSIFTAKAKAIIGDARALNQLDESRQQELIDLDDKRKGLRVPVGGDVFIRGKNSYDLYRTLLSGIRQKMKEIKPKTEPSGSPTSGFTRYTPSSSSSSSPPPYPQKKTSPKPQPQPQSQPQSQTQPSSNAPPIPESIRYTPMKKLKWTIEAFANLTQQDAISLIDKIQDNSAEFVGLEAYPEVGTMLYNIANGMEETDADFKKELLRLRGSVITDNKGKHSKILNTIKKEVLGYNHNQLRGGYEPYEAVAEILEADMEILTKQGVSPDEIVKRANEVLEQEKNAGGISNAVHSLSIQKKQSEGQGNTRAKAKSSPSQNSDNTFWLEKEGKDYVYTSDGIPIAVDELEDYGKWEGYNYQNAFADIGTGFVEYRDKDGNKKTRNTLRYRTTKKDENGNVISEPIYDWETGKWSGGEYKDLKKVGNKEFLFGDFDNDGVPNIDDVRPFDHSIDLYVDARNRLSEVIKQAEYAVKQKETAFNKSGAIFQRLKTKLDITKDQYQPKVMSRNAYIKKAVDNKADIDSGESSWDRKQRGELEDDKNGEEESRKPEAKHDVMINLTADDYDEVMSIANKLWDNYKKPRKQNGKMYRGTWKNFYKINRWNKNQWKGVTMKLMDEASGEVFGVEIATKRMRELEDAVGRGNLDLDKKESDLEIQLPDVHGQIDPDESIKIRPENLHNIARIVQKADSGDEKAQNFWDSMKDKTGNVAKEMQRIIGASSNFGILGNISSYLKKGLPDSSVEKKDWKLQAKVLGRRQYREKEEKKRRFENQEEYKKKKLNAKEWAKKTYLDYKAGNYKKK